MNLQQQNFKSNYNTRFFIRINFIRISTLKNIIHIIFSENNHVPLKRYIYIFKQFLLLYTV